MASKNGTDLNLIKFRNKQEFTTPNIQVEEVNKEIIKTETVVIGGSWIPENVGSTELLQNENRSLENSADQLPENPDVDTTIKTVDIRRTSIITDNNGIDRNLLKFDIKDYSSPNIKIDEKIIKTETEISGGSWVYQNVDINELMANENRNLKHSEEQLLNGNSGIKRDASEDYLKICERKNNVSTHLQKDNKNRLDFDREEKVSQQDVIETVKINNKEEKFKFLHDHDYCLFTSTLKKRVLMLQEKCEKEVVLNRAKNKKQKSERYEFNTTEKKYKCHECSYAGTQKSSILIHIQSHHTMERPYKCDECSYAAVQKCNLLVHIKSHHTKEKPYKCDECSYAAVQKHDLVGHIRSRHTMEKPYKCNYCSYASVRKQRLLLHIKHHHTMQKPYQCNECSYAAVQKHLLLSHIKRRHSLEKPYKCKECCYGTVQKHYLLCGTKLRQTEKSYRTTSNSH